MNRRTPFLMFFVFLVCSGEIAAQANALGVMPFKLNFQVFERTRKNLLTGITPINLSGSSRDNNYQEIYFEPARKALFDQIEEQDWLSGIAVISIDDLEPDGRRKEGELYRISAGNAMAYATSNGGRRRRQLEMMPYQVRPDLTNPFADLLDRNYLVFFSAAGAHYYNKSQADEPLPDEARGLFNYTAWVVNGNTGEFVLAVSSLGSSPKKAGIFYTSVIPEGKQPNKINERNIESAARSLLNNLERALKQVDLIE